mmetsp:Transcript_26638/g.32295  ORF Transcript_26638/g.32295 Transcript_26638/m.32295 type:complete len:284 (-) Transcript_26638:318-1169(-)
MIAGPFCILFFFFFFIRLFDSVFFFFIMVFDSVFFFFFFFVIVSVEVTFFFFFFFFFFISVDAAVSSISVELIFFFFFFFAFFFFFLFTPGTLFPRSPAKTTPSSSLAVTLTSPPSLYVTFNVPLRVPFVPTIPSFHNNLCRKRRFEFATTTLSLPRRPVGRISSRDSISSPVTRDAPRVPPSKDRIGTVFLFVLTPACDDSGVSDSCCRTSSDVAARISCSCRRFPAAGTVFDDGTTTTTRRRSGSAPHDRSRIVVKRITPKMTFLEKGRRRDDDIDIISLF